MTIRKTICSMAILAVAMLPVASVAQVAKPEPSAATKKPAAPSSDQCTAFSGAIRDAVKLMSLTKANGLIDNSAVRGNVNETRIVGLQAEVGNYIALMDAHRCKPYSDTLSPDKYLDSALSCINARLGSSGPPAQCVSSNW